MKTTTAALVALGLLQGQAADAFVSQQARQQQSSSSSSQLNILSTTNAPVTRSMDDPTFVTPDTSSVEEQACKDAAAKMKRMAVPSKNSPSGSVGVSYIHWPAEKGLMGFLKPNIPPLILLHGFDSSCLEYRRLGPKLAAMGIDVYAVDVLGWGFTQLDNVDTFSADAKIDTLKSFVQTKFGSDSNSGNSFCVAGASLGGAASIELAAALTPNNNDSDDYLDPSTPSCAGLILIDAQGFVDGVGPMAMLPTPLAKLGVGVLKSVPLRNMANQMSYFDTDTFATEDAQVIGRLHTLREGWDDAMVSFMQSGGFEPSAKVSKINAPALVLWGRQDTILDGSEFAQKFVDELPDAELEWIEDCGHVPHLEQPETTAKTIYDFLTSNRVTMATRRYDEIAAAANNNNNNAGTASR